MRRLKQLVCAFFVGVSLFGTAFAQGPVNASAEQEREYDAAFQEMLRKPADLDVLFKFATIATKTGDYEGAISALVQATRHRPPDSSTRARPGAVVRPSSVLSGPT